jgi:hypothetical protein
VGKSQKDEKLNQELYDLLFGAIAYIIEYSKKYGVPIPKKDEIKRAANRIHYLMDQIEPPIPSDEDLQNPNMHPTIAL